MELFIMVMQVDFHTAQRLIVSTEIPISKYE